MSCCNMGKNTVCSENASEGTKKRFDPQRSLAWWHELIRPLFEGQAAGPLAAEVWPTWRCQHHCCFCRVAQDRRATYRCGRPMDLSRNELMSLMDDLAAMGVKGLLFSGGGEPRMHPSYLDALEQAHRQGIQCALFTNLGLLPRQQPGDPAVRELRQEEAFRLVNCCELFIRCSLDAGSATTHERIHRSRSGEFEEILRLLNDLVEARVALPAGRPRPYLGVAYLAWFGDGRSPTNLYEIRPLAQRLKDMGLDGLQVRSSYTSTPEQRRQTQAVVDTCAYLGDETFDVFATDYGLGHSDSAPRCWAAELLPLIMPGYLLPCSFLQSHLEYALPFGGGCRFRDLWWSEERRKLFRNLDARGCPNCRFAAQNVELNEFHRRFMEGDPALERDVEAIIQRHNPRPTLI